VTADLFHSVFSWWALLLAMLVFGFAPGVVLRVIVLAFHRDDPRRAELLAELRVVPFIERPLWVAQQLEVALFEGLRERVFSWAAGRLFWRWHLESGVERNRQHPTSFWIPDDEEKELVEPGCFVKLLFEMDDWGERMWVEVTKVKRRRLVGTLSNTPAAMPGHYPGETVRFRREHIVDIDWVIDANSDMRHSDDPSPGAPRLSDD